MFNSECVAHVTVISLIYFLVIKEFAILVSSEQILESNQDYFLKKNNVELFPVCLFCDGFIRLYRKFEF